MIVHRATALGTLLLIGSCSCFLTGCQEAEGIHQVRVPAEYSERRAKPPATAPSEGETPAPSGLKYKTPEGWTVKPNSPFRLASLDVIDGDRKCDVSVSSLGPDQPVLDNVNRWRGQVKLPAATESELQLNPIKCGGFDGSMVELVGETETILAVTVSRPDKTWFVKLQGPNELAQRERDKFVAFTESIELP